MIHASTSEEDGDFTEMIEGLTMNDAIQPPPGGPFSALTPSMWPQDILARLTQPEVWKSLTKTLFTHLTYEITSTYNLNWSELQSEDPNNQPDYRFDEFGFRVEEEDGPEPSSNKLLGTPFSEDEQQRSQWISHLEFAHNKEASELTWDNVGVTLARTEKLRNMVRVGIPHSLRAQIWMRLSGALQKKMNSDTTYHEIVKASSNDQLMTSKQIEKDLLRIMPTNACFSSPTSTGVPRLRRILRGIAWLYPDIGDFFVPLRIDMVLFAWI